MGFWNDLFWRGDNRFLPMWTTNIFNGTPIFNDYGSDLKKMRVALKNPALLKVIALQCDLFSLGVVKVTDKDGKEIEGDPALDRLANPNPFQSQSQFLWDFMFWTMLGTANCYVDSDVVTNELMKLYFLEPYKMQWPTNLQQQQDQMIFADATLKTLQANLITYRYNNGKTLNIPLNKITILADLTNGIGNWYKGPSRIDALYKIITNSEEGLNSKNINLRFAGKFITAGTHDPNDVKNKPLAQPEKESILKQVNGRESVIAAKSMLEIKRFVEDMKKLQLDEAYLADYFTIGNMYNIPRDVLEANLSGSTYENQEKATGKHISYSLQPKGDAFMLALGKRWGYDKAGKKICIDWSYLPFMQVFEKDKSAVQLNKSISLTNLLKLNIPLEECNEFLGTNFNTANYVPPTPIGAAGQAPAETDDEPAAGAAPKPDNADETEANS